MSAKNVENTEKNRIVLPTQNDVEPVQCATVAVTAELALEVAAERTSASGKRSGAPKTLAPLVLPPASSIIGNDNESTNGGNKYGIAPPTASSAGGGGSVSSSSSCGGGLGLGADAPVEKRRSSSNGDKTASSKRKTRRGKTKRGKRSSSSRPYSKSQWKFRTVNMRRVEAASLVAATGVILPSKHATHPLLQSDLPPIVPYNTNRFLMEDHMPHVLTPSEDEEEFLTKEFSSVYEDARSERLEGLSKTQLIQEYLQLEANYDQVTRRYQAVKPSSLSVKEETESAMAKDAPEGSTVDRRRLEDRIRELSSENLELRRQLEHAARIGMVLSAKSSPRNAVERMDSSSCGGGSSSEDSESDSSTSTSSSSSDNGSSSSMSDDDDDKKGCDFDGRPQRLGLVGEDGDRQPLVMHEAGGNAADVPVPMEENECSQPNGDEDSMPNGEQLNGAVSPLSAHSINSPPPAPLVMN